MDSIVTLANLISKMFLYTALFPLKFANTHRSLQYNVNILRPLCTSVRYPTPAVIDGKTFSVTSMECKLYSDRVDNQSSPSENTTSTTSPLLRLEGQI